MEGESSRSQNNKASRTTPKIGQSALPLALTPRAAQPMATVTDKELREAFGIVSTSVQGLNETQLGTALRSLAFNPTDAFVKEIFGQLSSGGYVSADGLVKAGGMCAPKLSADTRKQKLKDAFTVFDKEGKGTIASAYAYALFRAFCFAFCVGNVPPCAPCVFC